MYMPFLLLFALTGDGGSGVQSALTTAFSSVASDALSTISAILPIALPIMGAVLVVMVGIRLFKSVAKK